MKAIILAAGVGSRLLPHTSESPKCLLTVDGRTILEYQLAALKSCRIDDVLIVIGHAGNQIRDRISTPVTFIENKDYLKTNSAYSLWLAREYLSDGFISINADLIFHPQMLQRLLDSEHEDAIVIDKDVDITGDMQKAEMSGSRITHMSKDLQQSLAAAEVVGPAKFSAKAASLIFNRISELVNVGQLNHWAYAIFNEVGQSNPFHGVYNKGNYWAEIDTPADLANANMTIPGDFPRPKKNEFLKELTTDTSVTDIKKSPLTYLDQITGSDFKQFINDQQVDTVHDSLIENKKKFEFKIEQLGITNVSTSSLYRGIQAKLNSIEKQLYTYFNKKNIHVSEDLQYVISKAFSLIPNELKNNYFISESAAVSLLTDTPPVNAISYGPYPSLSKLLEHSGALTVLAMTRFTEPEQWQQQLHANMTALTPDDFEEREIEPLFIHYSDYKTAMEASKQAQKPWRGSHSKETGKLLCLSIDDPSLFTTPLLLYVPILFHYFFEVMYASHFYQECAREHPEFFGKLVVKSFARKKEFFPAFALNIYSENIFWRRALELFQINFSSPDVNFFSDTLACGEYTDSNDINSLFSLNIVDQIWNQNFSGQNTLDSTLFKTTFFSYHFRQELWHTVFQKLSGLKDDELNAKIITGLATSDIELTKNILSNEHKLHE